MARVRVSFLISIDVECRGLDTTDLRKEDDITNCLTADQLGQVTTSAISELDDFIAMEEVDPEQIKKIELL